MPSSVIDTSKVVEETRRRIAQGDRRIALFGAPSSGKSTALAAVASAWAAEGRPSFRTSMGSGDDAGPLALTLLAEQVGVGETIRDVAIPWSGKLEAITQGIRKRGGDPVLVTVDDPLFEQSIMKPTPFSEHAASLIGALSGIEDVVFLVASSRTIPHSWGSIIKLEVETAAIGVLEPLSSTALAGAVKRIMQIEPACLAKRSPAEIRLGVALEHARKGGRGAEALAAGAPALELLRHVVDAWGVAARRALRRLAVLRTPFDDRALEELLHGISPSLATLVRSIILHRGAAGWVVPEIVGRVIRPMAWEGERGAIDDRDERRGHEIARDYHRRAFDRSSASADVLLTPVRHELEEVYHLTQLGDADAILQRSIYFVDQYNALGRRLGQLGVRASGNTQRRYFESAIRAYERVLEIDDTDAYANHYLAYNVDWLANDAPRAERHYEKALVTGSDQVWYHGRWISFLITRGRVLEAREAWSTAVAKLRDDPPPWLFEELHRQVARLLLHRGELAFASLVLDDLSEAAHETPWARAERRLLVRLEQAARDQLVFPSSIDPSRWWDGPHLVHAEARSKVQRWWAGRVEVWLDNKREVSLRLAEGPGRFGRKILSVSELSKLVGRPLAGIPAGAFIELVKWKGADAKQQIFVHAGETEDPDLPVVKPPADRYLRRAAEAAPADA